MDNIFELATRQKARYRTGRGLVSTEDLWDLSLGDLDTIAKSLNKELKESSEESFVKKQTTADKKLTLLFDVVKAIIVVKLDEEEKRKSAAERRVKRNQLLELISQKENDALTKKSIGSLRAELDKLDIDEEPES